MTVTVKLTDREHFDLQEIEDYSLQRRGRKVADRYLEDIQTALSLLQETPALLQDKSAISTHFKFYRVREHFLLCIKLKDVLLVLTIKHGQMDLSSRIGELEPTFRCKKPTFFIKDWWLLKKNVTRRSAKSNHYQKRGRESLFGLALIGLLHFCEWTSEPLTPFVFSKDKVLNHFSL